MRTIHSGTGSSPLLRTMVLLACLGLVAATVHAQVTSSDTKRLSAMSLEDLLNRPVMTVSKSAEKISDAPGVVSVITQDELRRFGGNTLYDILLRVPSLSPVSPYIERAAVAARGDQVGSMSSHILLLLNGRPVREAMDGGIKGEFLKCFPVDVIDHIEIIRGPGSVLYGSNAFSAVINVITVKPDDTTLGVTALAGNAGTIGASGKVLAANKSKDFSLVLGGRLQDKNEWDTTMMKGIDISVPDSGWGGYGELSYKGLRGMFSYTRWEPFYALPHRIPAFPHPYGTATLDKTFADVGYSHAVNKKLRFDLNATYAQSGFLVDHFPSTTRDSSDFTAELTGRYDATDKLRLIAGGLYDYVKGLEKSTITGIPTTDANKSTVSGYVQGDWRVANPLKLIVGMQANKAQGLKLDWNPRVGVIVSPRGAWNVKALYAQAFRAPSLNENFMNYATLRGDPNLKPEKVHSFDLGVSYLGEKAQVGVNGFYLNERNVIVSAGTTVPRHYVNRDKLAILGVELEGKVYFNRDVFASLSALYQHNDDTAGTKDVTPIPNAGVKAGLSYAAPNGVTASIFCSHQGNVADKYNNGLTPETKAFTMLNAYLSYDVANVIHARAMKRALLFAEVENALGHEIWLPAVGVTPIGYTLPYHQGLLLRVGLKAGF